MRKRKREKTGNRNTEMKEKRLERKKILSFGIISKNITEFGRLDIIRKTALWKSAKIPRKVLEY